MGHGCVFSPLSVEKKGDETRGILLILRVLLFRRARGGLLKKGQLGKRFNKFMSGQWTQLPIASRESSDQACQSQHRRWRTKPG